MRKKHLPYLIFILIVAGFLLHASLFNNGPYSVYDDSFITFRYAKNMANGLGLVFNPGEPVEGYTNFLWAVILAGAIAAGSNVVIASKILLTITASAIMWLTFDLGRRELATPWPGLIAAAMLAATVSFARYAVSGFETLLFGLWILLGVYLYLRGLQLQKAPHPAAIVLALAALTRPEGVMVFGVVTLYYLLALWKMQTSMRRRIMLLAGWLFSFAVIFVPYFIWRYNYYGFLLPNTFYNKVGAPGLTLAGRGLIYLRNMVLIANPQIIISLFLGFFWPGEKTFKRLAYGLLGVYFLYIVMVGGDGFKMFGLRFVIPLLPLIYLLGIGGAYSLLYRLKRRMRPALAGGLATLLLIIFTVWAAPERKAYLEPQMWGWIDLGEWMAERAAPGDTLAVDAAGITPFYSNLYTIDMFGLADLHIAHKKVTTGSGLAGHEKFDPEYVLARRPTYITSWINQDGEAITAGLDSVTDQLDSDYTLWVVAMMGPAPKGMPRIIENPDFSPELYEQGYIYGVFRRNN